MRALGMSFNFIKYLIENSRIHYIFYEKEKPTRSKKKKKKKKKI